MDVSENRGVSPKMDDENNGKPYQKWMIWGENPLFSETPILQKRNLELDSQEICLPFQDDGIIVGDKEVFFESTVC